ncbi:PTS transporter subunit EIIC [Streptomyces sp. M10(2022)]
MLPVALLAFCGIMLGLGSSLSSDAVVQNLTFLDNDVCHLVFTWMANTGTVAFTFLPVLFAMAIPLGLARQDKGVAAFAGFVGFASMNLAVNFFLTAREWRPRRRRSTTPSRRCWVSSPSTPGCWERSQ